MKCPKCGKENPAGELFCEACGEELKAEVKTPPLAKQAADQLIQAIAPAPAPVGKKVATLVVHKTGEEYDLTEGATLLVARADSDKCTPDIAIEDISANPSISSTPVEITGNADGTITIKTGGKSGFRLIQFFEADTEATAKVGDMIQLGTHLIRIE